MSTTPWRLLEGQTVDGKYPLRSYLGEGGFGAVFQADETVRGRQLREVAVKLICPHPHVSRDRQLEELRHSVNLDHPHILRCYTAGECHIAGLDLFYLVMELAQESMAHRMDGGTVTASELAEAVQHLASALEHLHAPPECLVHRDVKPGNLLRVGNRWKLADFGIARAIGSESQAQSAAAGTPLYMPPEASLGQVSPAWDMWSLGVLLVQALTGRAQSPLQLRDAILNGTPALLAGLLPPFVPLVRGCLEQDRRRRWPASRVCSELAALRADPGDGSEPTHVPPWMLLVGWGEETQADLPNYWVGKYETALDEYRRSCCTERREMDTTA